MSWIWFGLLAWTIFLGWWVVNGLITVEIGHRGLLLLFGERQRIQIGEGLRWIPLPFSLKTQDVKLQIMPLDKLRVMTADNVEVTVSATVTYYPDNLYEYLGVEMKDIKQGIDDARDQVIRVRVRQMNLETVLSSNEELGDQLLERLNEDDSDAWGIKITNVVIPQIAPSDSKVAEDLALKTREKLQRKGQIVEIGHFDSMVDLLVNGGQDEDGNIIKGGMDRLRAEEQVQMALGKATKNIAAQNFSLDPATAALVAKFLGSKN